MSDGSLRSLRFALWEPPSSSSLADEERVRSLLLTTATRETRRRWAGVIPFLTHGGLRFAAPEAFLLAAPSFQLDPSLHYTGASFVAALELAGGWRFRWGGCVANQKGACRQPRRDRRSRDPRSG
jgi:hypothetical protein